MNVSLFIPCFVDQLFPQTAVNVKSLLENYGCTVRYNPDQTCCGQPAFNAGHWKTCAPVARKFMHDLAGTEYIVGVGGSCTGFVRNYYVKLFPEDAKKVRPFALRFFEFTEFLTEVLNISDTGAAFAATAVYHDACGALRECRIKAAPRKLLAHVKGLSLLDAPDSETCCGFGGTFAVKFEPVSIGMGEQKVLNAVKAGADCIISTDWSCLMHLQGYIHRNNIPLKVYHIADVLAMRPHPQ